MSMIITRWRLLAGAGAALAILALAAGLTRSPAHSLLGYGTGGGAYVGPGDVDTTIVIYYGLRGLSAAVAAPGTQKAVRLKRADATTADIVILSNGDLDVATASTFCTASPPCRVITIYDQANNGFDAASVGAGPLFTFSCIGSHPCMQFANTANDTLKSGIAAFISVPYTVVAVASRTGNFTTFNMMLADEGNNSDLLFNSTADQVIFPGGAGVVASATDGALHSVIGVDNNASTIVTVDGADTTGSISSAGVSNLVQVGSNGSGNSFNLTGNYFEGFFSTGALSTRSALSANQHAYLGF